MMSTMSASSEKDADPAGSADSNGGTTAGAAEQGVLSQLPRTRPQRSSARRAASRRAGQAGGQLPEGDAATPKPKRAKAPAASTKRAAPAKAKAPTASRAKTPQSVKVATPHAPRRAKPVAEQPVPRQGFESESDRARGPVRPPGGTELLTSAAEIVGELTKAGFSTGERLLRSLLPRS